MPFAAPVFNLSVKIWRSTNAVTNPADVTTSGNLTPGSRNTFVNNPPSSAATSFNVTYLALPKLTDIRGLLNALRGDTVEAPAGSGRYYICQFVEDVGKGFPNEYRRAVLWQNHTVAFAPIWPLPTP